MDYERVLCIGDCHGKFGKFQSLYKKIKPTDKDLLIYLGDYIDRDKTPRGSIEMLNWAMQESKKPNVIVLRGNHEQMMFEFYNGISEDWLIDGNGGKETKPKMDKWFSEAPNRKAEVLNFIENLPLSHRIKIKNKEFFLAHAGIDPKKSLEEQTEDYLLWCGPWGDRRWFRNYHGQTTIVVGHTPVQFLDSDLPAKPIKVPARNVYLIDTGSFDDDGRISCIDLVSGRAWMSDKNIKD